VTIEHTIRFFMNSPFEPFTLMMIDGRELHVRNWNSATLGERAEIIYMTHPTRQVEIVDTSHIVSIRTIYASNRATWMGTSDRR